MDDGDELETQWTARARSAYAQRGEDLVDAVRRHVRLTTERTGRQRELEGYFESAEGLSDAARAFSEAEFDWCGSFPLPLAEEPDQDWEEEGEPAVGELLSVLGRWDYRVLDEDALVGAGRSSYLRSWPEDTPEDAELRVVDVESAAGELLHGDGLSALDDAPGLAPTAYVVQCVLNDGTRDDPDDPFGLARDPSEAREATEPG